VKLIGMLLIAFGIFALVMGGISYTDRDKVLDIGPVEVQKEDPKRFRCRRSSASRRSRAASRW
jgi:hypothetical protein